MFTNIPKINTLARRHFVFMRDERSKCELYKLAFVVIRVCYVMRGKPQTKMAGSYSRRMQRRLYKKYREYGRFPVKRGSEALGNLI